METLIKTLPAILAASGESEEVAEAACFAAWKHAVGETLSIHTLPLQFGNKTLNVAVADRVWQKQMEQLRGQLLFRLNLILGQTVVTSIEFQISPNKFARLGSDGEVSKTNEAESNAPVPIELVSAAAGIEDASLRRAFLGAAISCVSRLEKIQC